MKNFKTIKKCNKKNIEIYSSNVKAKMYDSNIFIGLKNNSSKRSIYLNKDYNKFYSKPIKIPKGFKKINRTKNKYSDSWVNNFICGTKKKIKKKSLKLKGRKYFIYDNGGLPFLVNVNINKIKNTNIISIYKQPDNSYFDNNNNNNNNNKNNKNNKNRWDPINKTNNYDFYHKLIHKYSSSKIFIPKCNNNNNNNDGNSILFKVNNSDNFIYIGERIYSFFTNDNIKHYYSCVGNSGVSYLIAIGENNIYFMLDKQYVDKNDFMSILNIKLNIKLDSELNKYLLKNKLGCEKLYNLFYKYKSKKYKFKKYKLIHDRI